MTLLIAERLLDHQPIGRANVRIRAVRLLCSAMTATIVCAGAAVAADASKDDAVAMVVKAMAFIKEQGPDKAYLEISNKTGKFVDRDLYVVVYQLDGKDMSAAQDVDGKLYVKERIELAAKQPSFWQDYKLVDPVSKKVKPKQ